MLSKRGFAPRGSASTLMRRDTLVFALAGIVFGFVFGYMAASWDVMPGPAPVAPAAAAPAGTAAPGPASAGIDPDEVKALESLAVRQPGDASVRVQLGNLYMDHQRWDEAIRWYREALAVQPANPDVRTDLGACFVSSGRAQEGLAEFETVLAASPEHRNALYNKGIALMQLGQGAEAAKTWEILLKRYPDDPQIQRLRARMAEIGKAGG
jgi:tetratricopeptide (TPR) repeat protein